MSRGKIIGTVAAVGLVVLLSGGAAWAQTNISILNGQWFKVKAALSGYEIDGETVLERSSGGGTVYLYLSYDSKGEEYELMTCTQDDYNPGIWYKKTGHFLGEEDIYGAVYPEVWDFGGNPLTFFNGYSTFNMYPTFYIKFTANGSALTKATLTTVSCAVWSDMDNGNYLTGSCKLSGSTIAASKVATQVPGGCK
jgi:hypothetical protein